MFIDSILAFQNIALFFDSNGNVKDLIGSDYKRDLEIISLARHFYNFAPISTINTKNNKLPEKLGLHINDILSISNIESLHEVIFSNEIFIFIAPNQTNKVYFKTVERINWKKQFAKNNAKLLFIKE